MNAILICTHNVDEFTGFNGIPINKYIKIHNPKVDNRIIMLHVTLENKSSTLLKREYFKNVTKLLILYHQSSVFETSQLKGIPKLDFKYFVNCSSLYPIDRRIYVDLIERKNIDSQFNRIWSRYYKKFMNSVILKVKLELLHSLLIPPKNLKSNFISYKLWSKLMSIANYTNDSAEFKAWDNFINEIKNKIAEYHKNPFDETYIKSLIKLRTVMLGET